MTDLAGPREKTIKALAVLSGNRCCWPDCTQRLYLPGLDTFVGQIAHICGERPSAARYDASLSAEELQGIGNLVLMCSTHHHVIDQNPQRYPVELLRQWKRAIEEGPSEAPDSIVLRGVDSLLESHTARVLGRFDQMEESASLAADAVIRKDLPMLSILGTGGRHLIADFNAEWTLQQVAGQPIGGVHYRFRHRGYPQAPAWQPQVIESRPGARMVAQLRGALDLRLSGEPLRDWSELAADEIGLEVAFEYAGRWWLRRFAARWRPREPVGKLDLVSPRACETVQLASPPG